MKTLSTWISLTESGTSARPPHPLGREVELEVADAEDLEATAAGRARERRSRATSSPKSKGLTR